MIGGQLSAPRRVVQSFPDDRGLQKTSTYIVPCFLFVEVSFLLKREQCTAAMMAWCAHQTWLTDIWEFHPDLIWMLNSTNQRQHLSYLSWCDLNLHALMLVPVVCLVVCESGERWRVSFKLCRRWRFWKPLGTRESLTKASWKHILQSSACECLLPLLLYFFPPSFHTFLRAD